MTRTGAIFSVYLVIFGGLVVVTILVAAALFSSLQDFIANLPSLRANLPSIIAPWQERVNGLGFTNVDLLAQVTVFFDNISQYAAQLVAPLQQLAVASLGILGTLLIVADPVALHGHRPRPDHVVPVPPRAAGLRRAGGAARDERRRVVRRLPAGAGDHGLHVRLDRSRHEPRARPRFPARHERGAGILQAIPFFGPFLSWLPPVLVAIVTKPEAMLPALIAMGVGWFIIMNVVQPRLMERGRHPSDRRARIGPDRGEGRGDLRRDLRHPDRRGV